MVEPGEAGVHGEPQVDATLRGQADLRDQQRRHRGVVDAGRDRVADLGPATTERADHPGRLVVLLELEQPGDGVQLVAELVGLRPQRPGDALPGVQLALHGQQLGAVAQGGDGPHLAPVVEDPVAVEHDDPTRDRQHRVADVGVVEQRVAHLVGERQVREGTRLDTVGQVEQLPRAVAEHGHDPVVADRHDALADRVQECLPLVGERADLGRLEPPRPALDEPGQQPGADHAQAEAEGDERQQVGGRLDDPLADRRVRLRHHRDPGLPAPVVDDRDLGGDRAPAAVVHVTGPGPSLGHVAGRQVDPVAHGLRVRPGDDRAVRPGEVDRAREVGALGLLGVEAERGRRSGPAQRGAHRCGVGDVLGRGTQPGPAGVTELGVALAKRHDARDEQDEQQDDQLEGQELPGQGDVPATPGPQRHG